jgi:hypothetical protein
VELMAWACFEAAESSELLRLEVKLGATCHGKLERCQGFPRSPDDWRSTSSPVGHRLGTCCHRSTGLSDWNRQVGWNSLAKRLRPPGNAPSVAGWDKERRVDELDRATTENG